MKWMKKNNFMICMGLVIILIFGSVPDSVFGAAENEPVEDLEAEDIQHETREIADQTEETQLQTEPVTESSEEKEPIVKSKASDAKIAGIQPVKNIGSKIVEKEIRIIAKDSGGEIPEGTPVPLDSHLDIHFSFTFGTQELEAFRQGDYSKLTIPDEIKLDGIPNQYFDIKDSYNPGADVARISIKDQVLSILLLDGANNMGRIEIEFRVTGSLDQEKLDGGGEYDFIFDIEEHGKYTVRLPLEEFELAVEKTSADWYVDQGIYYQTWELAVNTGKKELKNVKVVDTLPEGIIYDSYKIKEGNKEGWNVSTNSSSTTITFSHEESMNETVVIEVTTKVDDFGKLSRQNTNSAIQNLVYFRVINNVSLYAQDRKGADLEVVEDTDELQFHPEWVNKDGKVSISDKAIRWTLYVNAERAELFNLKVNDIIPKGLTLDETSIEMVKVGTDVSEIVPKPKYSTKLNADGTTSFTMELGDTKDYYIITYNTRVYDDFFTGSKKDTFNNVVYLTWSDKDKKNYRSVDYTSQVTAENNWIEKSGWWWPSRQYTEWFLKINPNQYEIDDTVRVVHTLPIVRTNSENFYQVFNSQKNNSRYGNKEWIRATVVDAQGEPTDEILKENIDYTVDISPDRRTMTIDFKKGVLSNRAVIFYTETEVPEEVSLKTLVENISFSYRTTASMYIGTNTKAIGSKDTSPVVDRSVSHKTVVDGHKQSNNYKARWRIAFNQNKLEGLGDVAIRDLLPEFLVYDTDIEVKVYAVNTTWNINRGNYTDPKKNKADALVYSYTDQQEISKELYTFEVSEDKTVLNFKMKGQEVNGKTYAIVFYSRVSDSFFAEERKNTTFQNRAYTTFSILPAREFGTFGNTTHLTSQPLKKQVGGYENGAIVWDIRMNNDKLDTNLAGVVIEDQLQEGLVLDVASVTLEKLIGTNRYENVVFDPNTCIKYDYTENNFKFTMPAGLDKGFTYILSFTTDVLKAGAYTNKAVMKNFMGGETSAEAVSKYITVAEYNGSATASSKQRITLTKVDEERLGLEGAEFELRTENGVVLEKAVSGPDGKVKFQALLRRETKYYIYETAPPRGYYLRAEPVEVYIEVDKSNNAVADTLSYTMVNEKIYVPVTLKKTEADGKPLAGAQFSVTPFYWEHHEDGERTAIAEMPHEQIYKSDSSGVINLGKLPFGLYAVKEEKAPDGYKKASSFLVVEITHPMGSGDYRVLYWDVVEKSNGTYESVQREPGEYGARINQIENELQSYKLTIYKTDASNGRPLKGAVFEVRAYDNKNKTPGELVIQPGHEDGRYESDNSGRAELSLTMGYYQVEEKVPPRGYSVGDNPVKIIYVAEESSAQMSRSFASAAAVDQVREFQLNFGNNLLSEKVVFQKTNEEKEELKGARFNLYKLGTDEAGEITYIPKLNEVLKVVESDEKGLVELTGLELGIYVLQESIAPAGYKRSLDAYVIELRLSADGTRLEKSYYLVKGGRMNVELENWRADYAAPEIKKAMETSGHFAIVNERDIVLHNFTIYKKAKEVEGMPLSGAIFEIWTKDGKQITEGGDEHGRYTTNFAGEINVQLPAGDYNIEEIKAPFGYVIKDSSTPVTIKDDLRADQGVVILNEQQSLDVIFEKTDEDGEKLEGAVFNLYQFYPTEFDEQTSLPVYNEKLVFEMKGQVSSDPEVALKDLTVGWYAIQEVAAPEGYYRSLDMRIVHVYLKTNVHHKADDLDYDIFEIKNGLSHWKNMTRMDKKKDETYLIPNIEMESNEMVDLSQLTVLKVDEDGESIAGVSFYVSPNEKGGNWICEPGTTRRVVLKTDSMGIASYEPGKVSLEPGSYYLFESSVPDGYKKRESPVKIVLETDHQTYEEVVNEKVKAEIIFSKQSRSGELLRGAQFTLYRAAADTDEDIEKIINMGDPSEYLRYHSLIISTKDVKGNLNLGKLPFGYYILQESLPPEGYTRDLEELIGIKIASSGEVTYYKIKRSDHSYTEQDASYERIIYNDPEGHQVRILKEDSKTLVPLPGAEFSIVDKETKEEVHVKGVTENGTYITNERGEIIISLPKGEYYLYEKTSPYGYRSVELPYFLLTVDGKLHEKVLEIGNERILLNMEMEKISDSGEQLENAVFNLYKVQIEERNGRLVMLDSSFQKTVTSDKDGKLHLQDVELGWYVLQEAVAPEGYYRSLDALLMQVEADDIMYYDVFGGLVNAEHYQDREVDEEEGIIFRNEYMYENTYEVNVYKTNHYTDTEGNVAVVALSEAWFHIWQVYEDGREIRIADGANQEGVYKTDLFGRFGVHLKPGTYRVEEVKAPEGYKAVKESYELIIEENGEEVLITFDGEKKSILDNISLEIVNDTRGELSIHKTDEKKKDLQGAEFELYRKIYTSTEQNYSYHLVDTYDMNGMAHLTIDNMRAGEYNLIETRAPEGYQLLEKSIEFEIVNGDEMTVDLEVENRPKGTTDIEGPEETESEEPEETGETESEEPEETGETESEEPEETDETESEETDETDETESEETDETESDETDETDETELEETGETKETGMEESDETDKPNRTDGVEESGGQKPGKSSGEKNKSDKHGVRTGDTSDMSFFFLLLGGSISALMLLIKRKKNELEVK